MRALLGRLLGTRDDDPGPSWHEAGRFVQVGERRLHVVDAGRGPTVLLLHGFLHSSWTWRHVVPALARRHRVLAVDLPGWGWSDRVAGACSLEETAALVRGLLAELGVERLALAAGNSMGGGVALRLALDALPVDRLLLVSPLALPIPVPRGPLRLLGHPTFGPVFRATAGNPAFVRRALELLVYRTIPVDAQVLRGYEPLARPGTLASACATARELGPSAARLAPRLGELQVPATVVWGSRDRVLPLRYGRSVVARLPGAGLDVFDGCGHCPQEEQPARFAALLERLLGAGAPAGGAAASAPKLLVAS